MPIPPSQYLPDPDTDFDREWDSLPLAELQLLDGLCDRFEEALARDSETRIEPFVVDLADRQRRLVVRELVQLEIEERQACGQRVSPDEFARRFPQWADELGKIAALVIERFAAAEIAAIAFADTIHGSLATGNDTNEIVSGSGWSAELFGSSGATWVGLPADGVLGHYRLQRVIGRGGMGVVVRARDCKLARDVAIKILAPEITRDSRTKERFLREAQTAAAVRQHHAVAIYSVEEINQIPFLVMELVEGTTLDAYLQTSGKLQTGEVVSLAYQTAQGLAAAHMQGLVHRDIKPANILLEKSARHAQGPRPLSQWNVKIADFGLARVATETGLTRSGLIAGTPQYMSPEQANGQEIGSRSDLFSLGSMMYAMCTGRPAFAAESAIGILRQVADKPAPALRELSPETPGWLVAIIEKLMAKSPDERFQSAAEVAELLGDHVHDLQLGRTATDSTTDMLSTVAPTHQRRRALLLIAAVLAGTAVVALGIGKLVRNNDERGIPNVRAPQVDQTDATAGTPHDLRQSWHGWPVEAPAPAIAPFDAKQANAHQLAWATYLGVEVETTNRVGMKFRVIPPGEFRMGSSEEEIARLLEEAREQEVDSWFIERIPLEGPQHHVTLTTPFAMSIHEVTRGQFRQFVESTGYKTDAEKDGNGGRGWTDGVRTIGSEFLWNTPLGFEVEQTDDHPVVNVSWNDAAAFCEWLSETEGVPYRLPSEAEWEYACRAGSTTRFSCGDDESLLDDYSRHIGNGGLNTNLVGQKKPSAWGLFDLHGNVFEWCQHGYLPYSTTPAVDPVELAVAPDRVLRGGSFFDASSDVRSTLRRNNQTSYRDDTIGFRPTRRYELPPAVR